METFQSLAVGDKVSIDNAGMCRSAMKYGIPDAVIFLLKKHFIPEKNQLTHHN